MSGRLTKETYIERANETHNGKYDYSLLGEKIVIRDKVQIICPIHGEFTQIFKNHMNGQGCPKCGLEKLKNEPARLKTKDEFIKNAIKIHGNFYDYSKVVYKGNKNRVIIICPTHGEFEQRPNDHLDGHGCPKCGNDKKCKDNSITYEDFLIQAKKLETNYAYPEYQDIQTTDDYVKVICPIHGEFEQRIWRHLKGFGCRKCVNENLGKIKRLTYEEFIERSNKVHGDKFIYNKDEYVNTSTPITIECKECGHIFRRKPMSHMNGADCNICANKKQGEKRTKTNEEYIEQCKEKCGEELYSYEKTVYTKSDEKVCITCKEHGDFLIEANSFLQGHGCPKHYNNKSVQELEVYEYIKSIVDENIIIINNDRNLLGNNELDIYIPELNLAFEYDGLYWHCEVNKDDDYHLKKTIACEEKGVRLIHIFEDEWLNKTEIIKSMIKNIINKTENKLYARKCEIMEVAPNVATQFLEDNHIQGKCGSQIRLALYYNNELVTLMTLGKSRHFIGNGKYEYELLRFCNKLNTNVIGGASKLFSYFIKKYNPQNVISYADRRWSKGNLYNKLNFTFKHFSKPNYFYIINGKREHRFNYRKSILIEKYNCPIDLSERQFCFNQKWHRIYDCGTYVFTWENNN